MEETTTSGRRIARNTLMLYLRMLLTMVVGLYTSRVVLATLGVEDYGIYGVVGGVVAMMGFLNASMSGATSRFLTFELGQGNHDRLAKTFSSALIVHVGIALVVLVLAETVGLWFLCNKLVIPPARVEAAHWVYQLSIVSTMLGITQVPYNATIIAHEKMDVYAYVEILNVTLKLLIVYLLTIGNFDKLILYAWLTLGVSVVVMATYRIYCLRHFQESHFHWLYDKTYLKPLLSFSGWNLFGNLGGIMSSHGISFVINLFYGVIANAAVGIAQTVTNVVNLFASNAMVAFRPPISKLYAQGEIRKMQEITLLSINSIMLLFALVAIPVFLECDYLLSLWLVTVPRYSSFFCRLMMISVFFELMRYIVIMDIHASGNVKIVSMITGGLLTSLPIIIYGLYRYGLQIEVAFIVLIIANALMAFIDIIVAKHYIPAIEAKAYVMTFLKNIFMYVLVGGLVYKIDTFWSDSIARLFFTMFLSSILIILFSFYFCFNTDHRQKIKDMVKVSFLF